MENTQEVLIVLLSIGMSVVLVFTVIALYYAIKILKSLRSITERAEHIADNVDAVSEVFRKTAGPAAIGKMLSNVIEMVKKQREGDGK